MKTHAFFRLMSFFSLIMTIFMVPGCKKDETKPIDTGNTTVIPYIKSFIATPATVNPGNSSKLSWNVIADSCKLVTEADTLNVKDSGTYTTPALNSNKLYEILGYGHDASTKSKISKSLTVLVSVVNPPPTQLDKLCQDWQMTARFTRFGQVGPLYPIDLQICEKEDTTRYTKSGWCYVLQGAIPCDSNAGHIWTQGTYKLSPDGKKLTSGPTYDIDSLTTTIMILHDTIPGVGTRWDDLYIWYARYATKKK